jgi:hypothetical protein
MRIRQLLRRDLDRKIEEVIQLDQAEPHAVYDEITEYVATDRIKDQLVVHVPPNLVLPWFGFY